MVSLCFYKILLFASMALLFQSTINAIPMPSPTIQVRDTITGGLNGNGCSMDNHRNGKLIPASGCDQNKSVSSGTSSTSVSSPTAGFVESNDDNSKSNSSSSSSSNINSINTSDSPVNPNFSSSSSNDAFISSPNYVFVLLTVPSAIIAFALLG